MKKLFTIFTLLTLAGCAASNNTTNKASEESESSQGDVYVFDNVETEKDPEVIYFNLPEEETHPSSTSFIVQLGAFTSKANASQFIKENRGINKTMNIVYNESLGYYLVQLDECKTKEEAELIKQELLSSGLVEDIYIKKIIKN